MKIVSLHRIMHTACHDPKYTTKTGEYARDEVVIAASVSNERGVPRDPPTSAASDESTVAQELGSQQD